MPRTPVSPVFAEVAKAIYGEGVDPREVAKFSPGAPELHVDGNSQAKQLRHQRMEAITGLGATGVAGVAGLDALRSVGKENKRRIAIAEGVAPEVEKPGKIVRALGKIPGVTPRRAALAVGGGLLALHGIELTGDALGAHAQIKQLKQNQQPDGVAKAFRLRALNPAGPRVPSLRARRPRISPGAPGSLFGKALSTAGKTATLLATGAVGGAAATQMANRKFRKPVVVHRMDGGRFGIAYDDWSRGRVRVVDDRTKQSLSPVAVPTDKKPVGKSVTWTGEIAKVDEDKHQVFGWASVSAINGEPLVDLQGDWVPIEETEKSAYTYVLESRKGGDMHARVAKSDTEPRHTADLIESFVVTPEKLAAMGLPSSALPHGWWVGFHVNDEDQWNLVKSGQRTGFSIHGVGTRHPVSKRSGVEVRKRALLNRGNAVTVQAQQLHVTPARNHLLVKGDAVKSRALSGSTRTRMMNLQGANVVKSASHASTTERLHGGIAGRSIHPVSTRSSEFPYPVRVFGTPTVDGLLLAKVDTSGAVVPGLLHEAVPASEAGFHLRHVVKPISKMGPQVKNWDQYHALRRKGHSKESAARITNAVSKAEVPYIGRHRALEVVAGGAKHRAAQAPGFQGPLHRIAFGPRHAAGATAKPAAKVRGALHRHGETVNEALGAYHQFDAGQADLPMPWKLLSPIIGKAAPSATLGSYAGDAATALAAKLRGAPTAPGRHRLLAITPDAKHRASTATNKWTSIERKSEHSWGPTGPKHLAKADDSNTRKRLRRIGRAISDKTGSGASLKERTQAALHPPPVKTHPTDSSFIDRMGYQPQTRRLVYDMGRGRTYTYRANKEVGEKAIQAPSKGGYYNYRVKNKALATTRVSPASRVRLFVNPNVDKRFVSAAERRDLEVRGKARPGGRFPIKNAHDYRNAKKLIDSGHGSPTDAEFVHRRGVELGVAKAALPDDNPSARHARDRKKAGLGLAGVGYLSATRGKELAPHYADLMTRKVPKAQRTPKVPDSSLRNVKRESPKTTTAEAARALKVGRRAERIGHYTGRLGAIGTVAGLGLAGEGFTTDLIERHAFKRARNQVQQVVPGRSENPLSKSHLAAWIAKADGDYDPRKPQTHLGEQSGGRILTTYVAPGFHGAVAGVRGKKLRAAANEAVPLTAGTVGGAALGTLLTRGRAPELARAVSTGGGLGGLAWGSTRNVKRGYLKPDPGRMPKLNIQGREKWRAKQNAKAAAAQSDVGKAFKMPGKGIYRSLRSAAQNVDRASKEGADAAEAAGADAKRISAHAEASAKKVHDLIPSKRTAAIAAGATGAGLLGATYGGAYVGARRPVKVRLSSTDRQGEVVGKSALAAWIAKDFDPERQRHKRQNIYTGAAAGGGVVAGASGVGLGVEARRSMKDRKVMQESVAAAEKSRRYKTALDRERAAAKLTSRVHRYGGGAIGALGGAAALGGLAYGIHRHDALGGSSYGF